MMSLSEILVLFLAKCVANQEDNICSQFLFNMYCSIYHRSYVLIFEIMKWHFIATIVAQKN
jgi:hypothetical protein